MPIFLKDVKRELQSDLNKVGKLPDGSFKFVPPAIVGRRLKDYTQLRVAKITSSARLSENAFSFSALVGSEFNKGIKYKITVEFHEMVFKELPSKQFFRELKISKGKGKKKDIVYHRTPSIQNNPVKMKCQCKDFQHRFEWPLSEQDGLIGLPTKYDRVTPKWKEDGTGGYPSVNSTDKVGICKHINSLLAMLRAQELIKER